MAVGFGPKRRVIPPSNLGSNLSAQRRVAEAAGRAAEKTRIALSVDSFPSRVWLRNPRGSIQCPCSSAQLSIDNNPLTPTHSPKIKIDQGEGADLGEVDRAYPLDGQKNQPGLDLPVEPADGYKSEWVDEIGRLLLGDGRRCGLCWGTGWIDGHRLWGGQRYLCCAVSTPWVEVDVASDVDIDLESPTPTLVGPGMVAWHLDAAQGINILDGFRVREGLHPAKSGWMMTFINEKYPNGIDVRSALDLENVANTKLSVTQLPTTIILTLPEKVRVSHVEMILRSEPLLNVQLPNMQLTASTELVQPFISEEFEVDPIVGWLERGSIIEIPGLGSRLGAVWIVTDVNEMRTAQGMTWGITGNCRNVQANETLACVALEDSLLIGLIDPGLTTRGFETTGADVPAGLNGQTDETQAAVVRDIQSRHGGGAATYNTARIDLPQDIPFLPTKYAIISSAEGGGEITYGDSSNFVGVVDINSAYLAVTEGEGVSNYGDFASIDGKEITAASINLTGLKGEVLYTTIPVQNLAAIKGEVLYTPETSIHLTNLKLEVLRNSSPDINLAGLKLEVLHSIELGTVGAFTATDGVDLTSFSGSIGNANSGTLSVTEDECDALEFSYNSIYNIDDSLHDGYIMFRTTDMSKPAAADTPGYFPVYNIQLNGSTIYSYTPPSILVNNYDIDQIVIIPFGENAFKARSYCDLTNTTLDKFNWISPARSDHLLPAYFPYALTISSNSFWSADSLDDQNKIFWNAYLWDKYNSNNIGQGWLWSMWGMGW